MGSFPLHNFVHNVVAIDWLQFHFNRGLFIYEGAGVEFVENPHRLEPA